MTRSLQQISQVARSAAQKRDWASVAACAGELLQRAASDPEGHFLAGLVEQAAGRPANAVAAFARALELDPARYDAAIELASQYAITSRHADAAALLGRYEQSLVNSPRYLDLAGTVYTRLGMAERAWPLYHKANELQPGIDRLQANLAACSVYVGRIEEAKAIYRSLLERHPNHQRNHYELSRLETATDDTHLEQMKAVLSSTALPPAKNIFLYYAIGKELEDLGRYDEAFRYYQMAGDAVTTVSSYDVATDLRLIDSIIETCDAAWLSAAADRAAAAPAAGTPMFIVGLPRTGTTLTERILSSHSQVESVGETHYLEMVLRRESGTPEREMSPAAIAAVAGQDIGRIAKGYMDAVGYRLAGRPLFIDKLPLNFTYLGFIAKAWPQARIVHLRRHPMDACFAMYKQSYFRFAYTLQDVGRYYLAYRRLMRHWKALLGDRLVEVQYESLVADQEGETRRLLDRLGLPFEQACLEFDRNVTASITASSAQIREKIHTRSVNRWKNFEKHLQPLKTCLEEAGIDVG